MAGQRGRDMLVRIGDGAEPETFVTVAGLRARSIALGAGLVDATTGDSPGEWRELLAGAGVKRAEVSGAGLFKDSASDALMRAAFFEGRAANFRLVLPDFGTLAGAFMISELSWGGAHDGEATFSVRLSSAGQVSFEAAS
jgi:TP901-1 family phage major tail protein